MTNKNLIIPVAAAVIGLVIGGLIGHYATPTQDGVTDQQKNIIGEYKAMTTDRRSSYNDDIIKMVNTDNLRENLRILTEKPHLAGTPQDEVLAELMKKRFIEAGFDWAETIQREYLLSRPNFTDLNYVTMTDGSGIEIFKSTPKEPPLQADDEDPEFIPAFNAYTPAGDVETDKLVYANYGRVEDFKKLKNLGVNVTGSIVIIRYGKIFRGNKVDNSEKNGALGVIMFSDPEDVALDGEDPKDVYPNKWWLPGSGMQRGTTFLGDGDPLTPGWPSTSYSHKIEVSEAGLAKIPAQPIGYTDARKILAKMQGTPAPDDEWKGNLVGLPYNLGPQLEQGIKIRLRTNNYVEVFKSYNVIGTITGDVEPDRYVIVGNHRDAWGYGASDPSSGTSQLLETARVLGVLKKQGWRPRRTLVFCSWGSEEYGLIGSTEWVEEHIDKLQGRTVAYINTDTCASGPILHISGSPLLWDFIKDVTKKVPGVVDPSMTLFEEWDDYQKRLNPNETSTPKIKTLGSGSDHAHFTFYGGIPAMDMWFRRDMVKYDIGIYPSYHTGYETFYMVSKIVDPEFKIHQGCSRLAAIILKQLTDSNILPFSIHRFPQAMAVALDKFKTNGVRDTLLKIYNKYPLLEEAVQDLEMTTIEFMNYLKDKEFQPMKVRTINDQLMKMERVFILPQGLPGRPVTRHAIFAPSQFDNYASAGFPGIVDLLYGYEDLKGEEKTMREEELRIHISDLTVMTYRAIGIFQQLHVF